MSEPTRSWSGAAGCFALAAAIGASWSPWAIPGWLLSALTPVVVVPVVAAVIEGEDVARMLAMCAAGWVAGSLHAGVDAVEESGPSPVASHIGGERVRRVVEGVVTGGPRWLRSGWVLEVEVEQFDGEAVGSGGNHGRIRLFVSGRPLEAPERDLPAPGDRIRAFVSLEQYPPRRFPSRTSPRKRRAEKGVEARAIAEDDLEVVGRSDDPRLHVRRWLGAVRSSYVREVLNRVAADRAAFVLALTAGARGLLADEQTRPFWKTETGHLLAISGLHLGIVAGLLWWGLGGLIGWWPWLVRRWDRHRAAGVAVLVVLGLYVLFVGAPVSARRAYLMTAGFVLASLVRLPISPLRALAAAGALLVAAEPDSVGRLGFQLSFAATAGILLVLARPPPMLERRRRPTAESSRMSRWGRRFGLGMLVSAAATVATWPVLLGWSGWVAPHAVWVNILVTPLVGTLVVPAALLGALLLPVHATLGAYLLAAAGEAMSGLGAVLSSLEFIGTPLVLGRLAPWAGMMASVGVAVALASRLRWRPVVTGTVLVAAALLFGTPARPGGELRIHFIPVGQGDATLVEFPDGETLLVDAGGRRLGDDPGRAIVVPYLRRLGIARLDWALATHGDVDHVGGFDAVADELRPEKFAFAPDVGDDQLEEARQEMRRAGATLVEPNSVRRSTRDDLEVRCGVPTGGDGESDNDRSVVCRVIYGGRAILLPGDIERSAERRMFGRWELESTLLKVPHHGSKTSSTAAWLDRVDPEVAVVSAGRFNRFGHPAESVVRRYRARDVELLETSRHGLIRATVQPDGHLVVRTTNQPE